MNVITASFLLFRASSSSNDRCDGDVALLQLNSKAGSEEHFSSSQVSLSPLERIGPNVHRHKLAFSEANATVSTTEPSYRELEGYWAGESTAASSEHHEATPRTPSEAKAMLKRDPAIVGYSFEKSHPDVAYVKTSGSAFVPSKDWVSVARADDYWAKPAMSGTATAATRTAKEVAALVAEESRKSALASLSLGESVEEPAAEEVFNWENPPPDHAPLKADGHEDENPSLAPLKADGHEDESVDWENPPPDHAPLKAEGHEDEDPSLSPLKAEGHEDESVAEPEGEEPAHEEVPDEAEEHPLDDAGAPLVANQTEHPDPGSLATGAALALLAAFRA